MRFAPTDEAEHTQLRLFGGADDLATEFDAAFVRIRPSEFEIEVQSRIPDHPAGGGRGVTARPGGLRRVHRPHAAARPHGPEPRSLVARAVGRRSHRRSADAALGLAHLRAIGQRGRRRHRLRSAPAPQHLDLRLGVEAGDARPLLQRGRSRRLRRARVRHRRGDSPRPLLHQRHGDAARQGAVRGDDDDDVEAGGGAHGARRVCARGRPPAAPARRQSEQPDRQSPERGLPRQRVHAVGRVQRPARAERDGSRSDRFLRPAGTGRPARRSATSSRSRSSRATSTATTRTGIRSPP